MRDPLAGIWERAGGTKAGFTGDEAESWQQGFNTLVDAGLVRATGTAGCVACDACADGHVEEVTYIPSPPGSQVRAYIHCPENGRVTVPLDRLQLWAVDFDGLARAAAAGLNLAGEVEELVGERLWHLGKATIAGRSRIVFLARGMTWVDGPAVFGRCERLNASKGALILVPGDLPPGETWTGDSRATVPLKLVTTLEDHRLVFDHDHIEGLFTGGRRKAPVKAQTSFPTPPGTTWQEVMVRLTDTDVAVEVKRLNRTYSFDAAGFENERTGGVPDLIWDLLQVFAQRGGEIPYDGEGLDQKTRTNLKQYVSELRKRLRALIPCIDGDPVPYIKRERCYQMAFQIAGQGGLTFPVPDGTRWPDITIELTSAGTIRVSTPATARYAASTYDEEADGAVHRWEAAEQETELEHVYSLPVLGLADTDGQPDSTGVALVEVLRNQGVVSRPADDRDMLNLCGVLTRLMDGVEGSPFDFASEKWIALFETSSELT